MASPSPRSSKPYCSKYTKLLLHLSRNLTKENMANIKLIICSQKMLHPDAVDEIQFGGDLIRALSNARLVKESGVQILGEMLHEVGRADLARLTWDYDGSLEQGCSNNTTVEGVCLDKLAEELPMSTEEYNDSQSSQQSSVSMTDEEKLEEKETKNALSESPELYDSQESQDLFD